MQCGAVMTRSVFFTIHIIHTPQLTREGEVWDVCFELKVWVTFCCYHYSTVSNIVINAVPIWIHVFVCGHLAYEWKSKYKMRTLIIAFNEKTNSLICAYIYVYKCVYIYIYMCMCLYIYVCIYRHMQCGAVMTRSVFFTIHIIHTPQLTREGEVWDVCFELEVWVTFCCYHYSTVSNIVINRTALWRRSAVWA